MGGLVTKMLTIQVLDIFKSNGRDRETFKLIRARNGSHDQALFVICQLR
jgi:hypothetical protein